MTVSSTNRRAGPFFGDGSTTAFPFAFKVFKKQDIQVVFTDAAGNDTPLVLDSAYTVSLNLNQDNNPGGTITYPRPTSGLPNLAVGESLTVVGALDYNQPTDLPNLGPFFAQVVENSFDRSTIQIQQLKEISDRSLQFPVSGVSSPVLPDVAERADKFLGFDSAGNLIMFPAAGSAAQLQNDLANPNDPAKGDAMVGVKQPFTGAAARTQHQKNSDTVTVEDFGAVGGGTLDDFAAIQAALNSGAAVVRGNPTKTYRCSAGITVPSGVTFMSDGLMPSNPAFGCKLVFDLAVSPCVTVGGPVDSLKSGRFQGFNVLRAAGTIPAGSIGVKVRTGYNIPLEDVNCVRHAIGYQFKADGGSAGIAAYGTRLFTGSITDVDVEIDSWPEAKFNQCRFGMNGAGDVAHTAYVRIKGGSTVNPASGPNTIVFVNCQMNCGGGGAVASVMEFVQFTPGSIADVGVFKFDACHIESFLSGIKTDNTVGTLQRIGISNTHFNSETEFFTLDPATIIQTVNVVGSVFSGNVTLNGTINAYVSSGNRYGKRLSLTGVGSSIASSSGDFIRDELALAGSWGSLKVDSILFTGGIYTNTATGKWSVSLPGIQQLSWVPTINFGGGSTGITYTLQAGSYEVRGNEVVAQFQIILSNKGTSTGNAFIGGLPVSVAGGANANSSNGSGGAINYAVGMQSLTGGVVPRTPVGQQVDLYQGAATGMNRVTDANFTNTTTIAGTIRYFR